MKKRIRAAGKNAKSRARGSLDLKCPTASKTIGGRFSAFEEAGVARRTRTTKSLRLPATEVTQRPVDLLAILAAGVVSTAIIVNAVFLQSGPGIREVEQLLAKLRTTHDSLRFEGERLQHKIDNASIRN